MEFLPRIMEFILLIFEVVALTTSIMTSQFLQLYALIYFYFFKSDDSDDSKAAAKKATPASTSPSRRKKAQRKRFEMFLSNFASSVM